MDGMTEKGGMEPAGLSERPQEAGGDKSAGGPPPQRYSAKRKLRVVSRLLRGEPLKLLARKLNVTAARLSKWRDRALLAAEAALKERNSDDRDDEIVRLKGKVGEMTMETELLRASPSASSAPSRRTCCGCSASRLSRTCAWHCSSSPTATAPIGWSPVMTTEHPLRSGPSSRASSTWPHERCSRLSHNRGAGAMPDFG